MTKVVPDAGERKGGLHFHGGWLPGKFTSFQLRALDSVTVMNNVVAWWQHAWHPVRRHSLWRGGADRFLICVPQGSLSPVTPVLPYTSLPLRHCVRESTKQLCWLSLSFLLVSPCLASLTSLIGSPPPFPPPSSLPFSSSPTPSLTNLPSFCCSSSSFSSASSCSPLPSVRMK